MYLNLILICLVNVLIIDLSGIITDFKSVLSKFLTGSKIDTTDFRLKPFDCSFCMTFWTGLVYLLCIHQFTILNLFIVLLLAFLTDPIKQLLLLLRDLIIKFINVMYGIFIDKN